MFIDSRAKRGIWIWCATTAATTTTTTTIEDAWEVFFPEILGGPWRNGLRERWFYRDFGGSVTQWALRAGISTHAVTPKTWFWCKKRDFLASGACLESKFMILTQKTWFFAQRSVPWKQMDDFDAKNLIFCPAERALRANQGFWRKNVIVCPAERALRANLWFWRQKCDFLNPLEPRSVLSKFDENSTVEKLSSSSCSWW